MAIDLSAMRAARDIHKEQKAKKLSETRERVATEIRFKGSKRDQANALRDRSGGGLVPVRMLDLNGNPAISFELKDKRRPAWIDILNGSKKSDKYKHLVKKLGSAFSRIYEHYRREAERRLEGKARYHMFISERKKCEQVGILCILKGITPKDLISYWDSNIRHFADGNILIPPLSFLASPTNVDTAAVSVLGSKKPRSGPRASPEPVTRRNSYAEITGLDPRLRRGLEAGGFSTQKFNDRYLMTVQHNALALAKGTDILIPDGKLRRMCVWAAENLYKMEEAG